MNFDIFLSLYSALSGALLDGAEITIKRNRVTIRYRTRSKANCFVIEEEKDDHNLVLLTVWKTWKGNKKSMQLIGKFAGIEIATVKQIIETTIGRNGNEKAK